MKLTACVLFMAITALPVRTQPLYDDFIKMMVTENNDVFEVYFKNLAYFDLTVTVKMALSNLQSSQKLPYTDGLLGKEKKKFFELRIKDASKDGKYDTVFNTKIGNMYAVHDSNYVYRLPFKTGARYKVVQGFFGKYSHDEKNPYAVDFKMPLGTPVHAAREGVVVGFFAKSDKGGPIESLAPYSNYVFIRHDDRTIAAYHHLQKNSIVVRIGQKVERGQMIARSGSSGFSFAPHLHFEVFKTKNGTEKESLPIKFQTKESIITEPIEGKTYVAK